MSKVVLSNRGVNKIFMPTNIYLGSRDGERKVVFCGRVFTEHEAQLAVLENKLQWYDNQTNYHPNWTVLRKYIDEGTTGTSEKNCPSFMQID